MGNLSRVSLFLSLTKNTHEQLSPCGWQVATHQITDHNPESCNPYFTLNHRTLSTQSNLQTPIQIPHCDLLGLAFKAASDEWNDPEVQLCNPILHSHSEAEGVWKFRVYLDKQFELNVITNTRNKE